MGLYLLKYPGRRLLLPLSPALRRVHPDVVSYAAVGVAVAAALCFYGAAQRPWLLLLATALIGLRMMLNTLDGLLAMQRGRLSRKGEMVNALPDRYSDVVLVAGIALSPLCRPAWGLFALASMLLVSYTGVLGKALGVDWQHQGPLGKVERLLCLMACSVLQYVCLRSGRLAWTVLRASPTPLECGMLLFAALGQVTVLTRTRGMLRQIARLEWPSRRPRGRARRALIVYDSATGNTERLARAVGDALGADVRRADDATDLHGRDLVVIGTPTIRGAPSEKVIRFLRCHGRLPRYAAFATYGLPLLGRAMARKCLDRLAEAAGAPPVATFTCKGRHARFHTCRGHPNDDDLLSAFLFGMKLARGLRGQDERP
jgi:phosphatidylglycerophosphate synthase